MTIVGMLTCGRIATESYAFDQLLGLFIFTNTESYFPLFHWMIFPAFGMVYGDALLHVNDKKKFYGRLLILTTIVFVIYYYFGVRGDQNVFTVFKTWQSFSYMSIYDAFMQLFCNTAVICICFFIRALYSKWYIVNLRSKSHMLQSRIPCLNLKQKTSSKKRFSPCLAFYSFTQIEFSSYQN